MTDPTVLERSLRLVFRMATWTLPTIFVFQYLRFSGRLDFLGRFSSHVVHGTPFDKDIGHAFLVNLGSAHVGGGMLVDMHRKGVLTLPGIVLASVFISFLPSLRLLITRTAPVAFSLLPLTAGAGYVLFVFAVAVLKMLSARSLSKRVAIVDFDASSSELRGEIPEDNATPGKQDNAEGGEQSPPMRRAWAATWGVGRRALLISFCSSLVIYWLSDKGVFDRIPIAPETFGLPPETLKVFAAWIAHPYAGMGVAGDYVSSGTLTSWDVLRVGIVCSMLTRPLWMIREAPGYYVGLYGLRVGPILMLYHLVALYSVGLALLWGLSLWRG